MGEKAPSPTSLRCQSYDVIVLGAYSSFAAFAGARARRPPSALTARNGLGDSIDAPRASVHSM